MKKKHGHSPREGRSPTYISWMNMKGRCINPNDVGFERYGGRGIFVCNRWLDFNNFLEDMGEMPEGLTLDRVDNNDGYYKGNCKWSTRKEQARNRNSNKLNLELVDEIRELDLPYPVIGAVYNVTPQYIGQIKRGEKWKD